MREESTSDRQPASTWSHSCFDDKDEIYFSTDITMPIWEFKNNTSSDKTKKVIVEFINEGELFETWQPPSTEFAQYGEVVRRESRKNVVVKIFESVYNEKINQFDKGRPLGQFSQLTCSYAVYRGD